MLLRKFETFDSLKMTSFAENLEFLTTMSCLSFRNVGFEYMIICKAVRGVSFVVDVPVQKYR